MKKTFTHALLVTALVAGNACSKKEEAPAQVLTMSGELKGASVLPKPVNSTGTGTVTGTFNMATNELTYTVAYAGLSALPTTGHFHIGVPPANVGPVHAITFTSMTSPITGKATLATDAREALLAGNMYVNIHSQAYPDGEIRANVVVK